MLAADRARGHVQLGELEGLGVGGVLAGAGSASAAAETSGARKGRSIAATATGSANRRKWCLQAKRESDLITWRVRAVKSLDKSLTIPWNGVQIAY
jgi:hypothetical protein